MVIAVLCALVAGCATSPTGRKQLMLVSDQQMNHLGVQAFNTLGKQVKFADAPREQAYARCVADALIAVLPARWRNQPWQVRIIRDNSANAFALPGGRIGVNQGMFKVATTPAELAAVLGHELAHVVSRHGAERMSDNLAVRGAVMAGTLYGAAQGNDAGRTMAALGLGAQVGILLPFSRTQESEADTLGQRYMAEAGFDPRAAVTLWQKLAAQGGKVPVFLSTHPSPGQRASKLAQQAQALMPVYRQALQNGHAPRCTL